MCAVATHYFEAFDFKWENPFHIFLSRLNYVSHAYENRSIN